MRTPAPRMTLVLLLLATTTATITATAKQELELDATVPLADVGGHTTVVVTVNSPQEEAVDVVVKCGFGSAKETIEVSANLAARRTFTVPSGGSDLNDCDVTATWTSKNGKDHSEKFRVLPPDFKPRIVVVDDNREIDQGQFAVALEDLPESDHWSTRPDDYFTDAHSGDLPNRWQGYPPGSALFLAPAADLALSKRQREALRVWTLSGGTLMVLQNAQRTRWETEGARIHGAAEDHARVVDKALPRKDPTSPRAESVPGANELPIWGFMSLVLLFAVLAGPVNLYWVLVKKKVRALFLLTTPAVSLVACVVLTGYSFLAQDWELQRTTSQIVWLDAANKHAFTWTTATYFGPTNVEEFELEDHVRVRAYDLWDHRDDLVEVLEGEELERVRVRLERTADHQLASGLWIAARTEQALYFAAPRRERARLSLRKTAPGKYEMTNGLGVDVEWVEWRDARGVVHHATDIASGASAALEYGRFIGKESPSLAAYEFGARAAWKRAASSRRHFIARLSAPLHAVPGPEANEADDARGFLMGPLSPEEAL